MVELEEAMKKDEKIVRHMVVIKKPAKERKIRGTQRVPQTKIPSIFGTKTTPEKTKEEPTLDASRAEEEKTDKKVELKDIEQKLDEILGE